MKKYDKLHVGWILSGNIYTPGARIHGINIHNEILKQGGASTLLRVPESFSGSLKNEEIDIILKKIRHGKITLVIFQKVSGDNAVRLVKQIKKEGVKTVFIACDSVDSVLGEYVDLIMCVSKFIGSLFDSNLKRRIKCIDDPLEIPTTLKNPFNPRSENGILKAVYLSSRYPDARIMKYLAICSYFFEIVIISRPPSKPIINSIGQNFTTPTPHNAFNALLNYFIRYKTDCLRRIFLKLQYKINVGLFEIYRSYPKKFPFSFIEWNLEKVYENLANCNIGLLPVLLDSNFKMAKSSNRLITLLASGLPVIASPVPSYLECVRDKEYVKYASNPFSWFSAAKKMAGKAHNLRDLGDQAKTFAWEHYNIETVTCNFMNLIENIYIKEGTAPP